MTDPRPAVLCVGQLVADVVVRPVDGLPAPGQALPIEDFDLVAGGCAANTACVLAKLGADVRIAALVGADAIGDGVLAEVRRCGVDVSGVSRSDRVPTSAVVVLVDGRGERSFLYRPGGNEALTLETALEPLRRGVRFAHIGGSLKLSSFDVVRFLDIARDLGCTTSLDTDWDVSGRWMETLGPALPRVDILMTNREEGRELTGAVDPGGIARRFLAAGPRTVVVKCGAEGSVLGTGGSVMELPAYAVPVRDTTCAGDAFAAGFLYALARGWPEDRAARVGNAAGALTTTAVSHRGVTGLAGVLDLVEGRAAR